ncbi:MULTISPECIES: quinone-dependent dihydroorotate dehydrogenase [unclassified Sphingomonas]|uniref:quinone-dependent dihydroorotate dehydrogenase n=1 Tax=unclassified Sphingomonas TaxID=196159 RepID=UPI000928C108|nr:MULTISPECIES: quinone-dependent dihydroorotate dehydrogenase [unclassified Sphingomonas]OJU22725.1 MAG: dihydroorotate dehydrogenase (quinone) [Sphingomonas sp. 66-10]
MPTAYDLIRPAIFCLDPERAHRLSVAALKAMPRRAAPKADAALAITVAGVDFPNPLGIAAGFDKDAEVPDALLALGFGFAEVGTITPLPQPGNPRPRLFRLAEDRAVINRFGFNSQGGEAAARRLAARAGRGGIVGVNIGANKEAVDRIADYVTMARLMAPHASYLTLNISSPNTPGLRALQDVGALHELLDRVGAAVAGAVPVFLKVAPDLQPEDVDAIARAAIDRRLGALMVSNTTIGRPPLRSAHAAETGGLSGEPLRALALTRLRDFRKATGGEIPLVGIGGIASADHAWDSIRAGASLVQLYSAMVYEGPGIARRIVRGLEEKVRAAGLGSIAEAVGSE